MNFYSHAVVAERERSSASFVLGAMLPDFEGMAHTRLTDVHDEAVREGIACHHRTDEAFHGAPAFVQSCARSVAVLTAQGLPRGPARAIAHVGLELVLDSFLVRTYGPSSMYLAALEQGQALLGKGALAPRDRASVPALSTLLARLRAYGAPRAEEPAANVTERLLRMLRHRPRLAIPEAHVHEVAAHIGALAEEMDALGPVLFAAACGGGARTES